VFLDALQILTAQLGALVPIVVVKLVVALIFNVWASNARMEAVLLPVWIAVTVLLVLVV
jgi:hypothetical protein